jgi:hypothetical protein
MSSCASSVPPSRSRTIAYWIATVLLAAECAVGGVLDVFQFPPFIETLVRLGYPTYFSSILGAWKLLAVVALLAPRSATLKEWAYAGIFFNMTGAAASHLAVGDGPGALVGPLAFTGLTLASWALRPPARRETRPR